MSAEHDDKGFSEEKCVRCGWVMGSPPLNCQNDDTPHVFPSQQSLVEQFEAAQEAIRRIADDVHLVLKNYYSRRVEERVPALPTYARLTVIVEENEDRIRLYATIGNAVTVQVAKWIKRRIVTAAP